MEREHVIFKHNINIMEFKISAVLNPLDFFVLFIYSSI